ncbi:MAG: FAD:protein FMN transferase [Planctomycetota bacterium]
MKRFPARALLITALAVSTVTAALLLISMVLVGCGGTAPQAPVPAEKSGGEILALRGEVMKTSILAKAVYRDLSEAEARKRLAPALAAANEVERLMSRFIPDSDVSRLSSAPAGTPVRVDPRTVRVLALATDIHRRSGGAYDVTVGPLIGLYKWTGRELKRPPTDAEIAEALKKVGTDKLTLDEKKGTAALRAEGMLVDLSSVAKGFAVDLALDALRRGGADAALVEIGGEVRAYGLKPDGSPWRVGIRHPRSGTLLGALDAADRAVATSGDYQKYFKQGGRRASHILDPRTGRPLVGGAVSVTVLAPECALADGLATAISVLGAKRGLELVESYRREGRALEALIIEESADGKLEAHTSPGLAKLKPEL